MFCLLNFLVMLSRCQTWLLGFKKTNGLTSSSGSGWLGFWWKTRKRKPTHYFKSLNWRSPGMTHWADKAVLARFSCVLSASMPLMASWSSSWTVIGAAQLGRTVRLKWLPSGMKNESHLSVGSDCCQKHFFSEWFEFVCAILSKSPIQINQLLLLYAKFLAIFTIRTTACRAHFPMTS